MKQIIFLGILIAVSNFCLSQSESESFFELCQSKKSNAEICQCMSSKNETLKISLAKGFDTLIRTAKEISTVQKNNHELVTILKKQIDLLYILKNTMIQNAIKIGELRASSSLVASGYNCFLAEEQFEELNKIKIFLEERKEDLNSFK